MTDPTQTHAFPTDTAGLPEARPTDVVELGDGGLFEMTIEPVAKQIGEDTVRMLGYGGSVPGPTFIPAIEMSPAIAPHMEPAH